MDPRKLFSWSVMCCGRLASVSCLSRPMCSCSSSSVSPSRALSSLSASSREPRTLVYTFLGSAPACPSSSASSFASSPQSRRFSGARFSLPPASAFLPAKTLVFSPLVFSQAGTSMSICAFVRGLPGWILIRRSPVEAQIAASLAVIMASPRSMPSTTRAPLYSIVTLANCVRVLVEADLRTSNRRSSRAMSLNTCTRNSCAVKSSTDSSWLNMRGNTRSTTVGFSTTGSGTSGTSDTSGPTCNSGTGTTGSGCTRSGFFGTSRKLTSLLPRTGSSTLSAAWAISHLERGACSTWATSTCFISFGGRRSGASVACGEACGACTIVTSCGASLRSASSLRSSAISAVCAIISALRPHMSVLVVAASPSIRPLRGPRSTMFVRASSSLSSSPSWNLRRVASTDRWCSSSAVVACLLTRLSICCRRPSSVLLQLLFMSARICGSEGATSGRLAEAEMVSRAVFQPELMSAASSRIDSDCCFEKISSMCFVRAS
mmetsp:Transcript_7362/g.16114  ORF Transcript_7362/g.16114 Transcript_7362/m.16114 type:complete len:490 (-) Transcript_7362:978-2447(-)